MSSRSSVKRGLSKGRGSRRQNRVTRFELSKSRPPGGLHRALKMHWLHAHQRQSSSPREQASRARARREMNVLLQGTAQPVLFLGSNFGEPHEIAVEHFLRFGRH